jgi:phosphomannomutase / phosphoglucomutase
MAGLIAPTGFREYDARWVLGPDLDLAGIETLGLALATLLHDLDSPRLVTGHDYRSYSGDVKAALIRGLMSGGAEIHDIGLCLTPMAYFAREALGVPAVAMVTASHNENGWTGVKMGAHPPFTFGPEEMARLKTLALEGGGRARPGGKVIPVPNFADRYWTEVSFGPALSKPIRVVAACGNGTAGAFVPEALRRMGAEVIEMDTELDWTFPRYNPNPEDRVMLDAMAARVRETGADLAFGFDGDGDRCGVVDDRGHEIFADRMGLMLARDLVGDHPGATFVVDVKSTGLYRTDPVLAAAGARVVYGMTGHSHMKRAVAAESALAGFEKSGHVFFAPPLGRGYDDALVCAREVLRLIDRSGGRRLSELEAELPPAFTSLTMNAHCADETKYGVVARVTEAYRALAEAGGTILGRGIRELVTVNGVRVELEDGGWLLVRASSNKPELVVVVESLTSEADMRALFHDEVKPRLAALPEVGGYNQQV